MRKQMEYKGDTGDLTIFSSLNGEVLFKMRTMDVEFIHGLDRAFRRAEELAGVAATIRAGQSIMLLAKEMGV